jgi:asparagine synthase (glutamine-hydrolysing)
MCGIWALLGLAPANVDRLVEKLKPRGPEYTQILDLMTIPVILGFTRLAINGLTPAGNQPFQNGSSYTICNGEIYNYKELAQRHNIQLEEGTSDCAVISHLIEKLPLTEVCRTLDGVFAFVYVNTTTQRMYVARDPYGVRPLYHGILTNQSKKTHIFASEIKALPVNCETVTAFPPGTWEIYCTVTNTLLESHKYHNIPHDKPAVFAYPEGEEMSKLALEVALTAAVEKRLLSDRPIGALLSGGLDSSLVCAVAARFLQRHNKRLHTFSIGMPGSTDLDYADQVAAHINSIHHRICLTTQDFIDAIPHVIEAIESYDITTVRASVGNWLIGKYIKENTDIKVVFNGDGSDEIGGGYLYFFNAPTDEEFESECERLLTEINLYDVLRSDRSMAAHGLEARTPFLDKQVVATWLSIATKYRRPSGQQKEKYILRKAMELENYLPYDVLWRKKEAFSDGVSATTDSWYVRCLEHATTVVPSLNEIQSITADWHNPPKTQEAYYYRQIFNSIYGNNRATVIPHMWMPKWSANTTDPSARTLTALYSP